MLITMKIGDLFKALFGDDNLPLETPIHASNMNIKIKTPNSYAKINYFVKKRHDAIVLTDERGVKLTCSTRHILETESGLGFAEFAENFRLSDGSIVSIIKREHIGVIDLYDMSIPAPHLYVTPDDIVHHNTSVAKAMLEELGCDYIIINGSMNGNIDTLRNEIQNFASSMSLAGGRKYVILDEADGLNATSTQPALRNFMESFSANCGFILTCNFPKKIIEPLHSRCTLVDFRITKKDLPSLATQFMKRVGSILETEGIDYDKAAVAAVIKKHLPDWRRILNELQRYSATGKIDSGILVNMSEISLKELMKMLKERNFTEMRKWVAENLDGDATTIYRNLYDTLSQYVTKDSLPLAVLQIGKYQYQHSFVADAEINLACCLTELMVEAEFV